MESGVIYYEYEKREKFEDYDMKADAELGTFKIRCYHFDDESFVHLLHSVRFDPDSSIRDSDQGADGRSTAQLFLRRKVIYPKDSFVEMSNPALLSERKAVNSASLRKPRSWELTLPSECWMCDGDDEKRIGEMEPSVEKKDVSKEDPEEEMPASSPLPMDIDANEDFLRYIEEMDHHPEPSPLRKS
ncbi:hypothetical protein PIB30_074335 [Stylosanthes scabra]|uniref:Uncharacterized protein n=1 Tax=Stylosanthes scabra TaxID=79078 RepID=A0ABU6YM72_9FABA|nr:hypothetical protein [Stylosanthes scabra]